MIVSVHSLAKESENSTINLANEYINISFSYISEVYQNPQQYLNETSERFSLFHVYLANKTTSSHSGKVDSVSRVHGKLKSGLISNHLVKE